MNELSILDVREKAPSVFSPIKYSGTSDKYQFLSTSDMLQTMIDTDWHIVDAFQSKVRLENREGFQKHLIRLRHPSLPLVNGSEINVLLINSHDGKSSYQFHAGVYRLVCSNGMIVGNECFDPIRLSHKGITQEEVVDAQFRVLETLPRIGQEIEELSTVIMSDSEKIAFARSALELRWSAINSPVKAEQLLESRRSEDRHDDLYTVFNVVQENLIKGGLTGRQRATRSIKAVNANVALNKALWTLADEMKKLKG